MFCSNCGTQLSEGTRFCPKCGTPQAAAPQPQQAPVQQAQPQQAPAYAPYPPAQETPPEAPPQTKAKKPVNKKLLMIIAIAAGGAVLLTVLAIVLALVLRGGGNLGNNFVYQEDRYTILTELDPVFQEDQTYYLTDGTNKIQLDAYPDDLNISNDGSQGFFTYNWDSEESYEWLGELYHFDAKGLVKINKEVQFFQMSADGTTAAYVIEEGLDNDYEVHYWRNGKDEVLGSFEYIDGFVISPDGSTVVYRAYSEDDEPEAYMYRNGSSTLLEHKDADTALVLAVSNDGSLIYYTDQYGDGLRVFDGKDDIRLGKDEDHYSYITTYFNFDCTQIMYHDNGKTFVWAKGDAEPTEIDDDPLYLITPKGIQYYSPSGESHYILGVKEFKNIFVENDDDKCMFLDRKLELNDVIKGYDQIQLATDGKTIVALKRDDLYKFDGTKEYKNTDKIIIAEDFEGFNMTPDAKSIYLIDDYGDLYYLQAAKKTVKIAEEISEPDWFYPSGRVTRNGRMYFIADDELCYAIGEKITTITGFDGKPDELYVNGNNVIVYTYDDDSYDEYCYHVSVDGEVTLQYIW